MSYLENARLIRSGFQWPGYKSWTRQIKTKDWRREPKPITKAKLATEVAKKVQNFIQVRLQSFSMLLRPIERSCVRITSMSPCHLGPSNGGSGQVSSKPATSCLSVWYMFRRVRGRQSSESSSSLRNYAYPNTVLQALSLVNIAISPSCILIYQSQLLCSTAIRRACFATAFPGTADRQYSHNKLEPRLYFHSFLIISYPTSRSLMGCGPYYSNTRGEHAL